jgi:hypothetical protein
MTSPPSYILCATTAGLLRLALTLVLPGLGSLGCSSDPPSPLVVIEESEPASDPVEVGPPASERLIGAFVHRATLAGVEGEWGVRWDGHSLSRSRDGVETGADICEVLSDGPLRVVLMCRSVADQETRRPWVFDGDALVDELTRMRFERDGSVVVERYVSPATEGSSSPPP